MSYKPVPLSGEWIEELNDVKKQRELDKNLLDRISDLAVILHAADIMVDLLDKKKRQIYKVQELQLISYYYFAHCYHLAYGLYHLSKKGFGSASLVLIRTIIESTVNLAYIWLCKEINGKDTDEIQAWGLYSSVNRDGMNTKWNELQVHRNKKGFPALEPEKLMDNESAKEYAEHAQMFKDKYDRKHWAKITALDARARAVDDTGKLLERSGIILEEVYVMCYKWISELVHGDSASTGAYMQNVPEKMFIDFGPSFQNVDIVIPMCSQIMLTHLDIVNHINHLNIDLLIQYKESGLTLY